MLQSSLKRVWARPARWFAVVGDEHLRDGADGAADWKNGEGSLMISTCSGKESTGPASRSTIMSTGGSEEPTDSTSEARSSTMWSLSRSSTRQLSETTGPATGEEIGRASCRERV